MDLLPSPAPTMWWVAKVGYPLKVGTPLIASSWVLLFCFASEPRFQVAQANLCVAKYNPELLILLPPVLAFLKG